jgi:hypothetical protein
MKIPDGIIIFRRALNLLKGILEVSFMVLLDCLRGMFAPIFGILHKSSPGKSSQKDLRKAFEKTQFIKSARKSSPF